MEVQSKADFQTVFSMKKVILQSFQDLIAYPELGETTQLREETKCNAGTTLCLPSHYICEGSSVRCHCVRTLTHEDTVLRLVKLDLLLCNAV